MKKAPPQLIALFSADIPFEQFDLYTITLQTGLVLRYTNCPFDVIYNGSTWYCSRGPNGIVLDEDGDSGPRGRWTSTLDAGSWAVNVLPRDTDKIGDLPWLPAVRAGLLDEASVKVDRGYVLTWPTTLQLVPYGVLENIFFGRVAELDFGRSSVTISMNDPRELLQIDMPRNLFSAECRYALFDSGCTLNKAAFAIAAVVNGVEDNQALNTTATTQADGYFALGEVVFVTGKNAGLRSLIRDYTKMGGLIELLTPMPFDVMNGDQITLYPGCDKTSDTCTNKFLNLANWGGTEFIPVPETST